jgi:hypothetical protein
MRMKSFVNLLLSSISYSIIFILTMYIRAYYGRFIILHLILFFLFTGFAYFTSIKTKLLYFIFSSGLSAFFIVILTRETYSLYEKIINIVDDEYIVNSAAGNIALNVSFITNAICSVSVFIVIIILYLTKMFDEKGHIRIKS